MGRAVRVDQAVHAEVAVVGELLVVAAVAVDGPVVRGLAAIDRVVAPLPHKAARKAIVPHNQLLVVLRISGAVAHGVDVLAQHKGRPAAFPGLIQLRALKVAGYVHLFARPGQLGLFGGGVHAAVQVQHREVRLVARVVDVAVFIVQQAAGVVVLGPAAGRLGVGAPAALVAQRPADHGSAVFVPHHVALGPVHNGLHKLGVRRRVGVVLHAVSAQLVGVAVAFQVRLGDDIEAVLAAQLGEPGGVGVVAGADGVYIVLLHQQQVPHGLLQVDGIAGDRVAVVAVYAPEFNGRAVKEHHAVLHLNFPQAYLLLNGLAAAAEYQLVLLGAFGVPQLWGANVEVEALAAGGALAHQASVRRVQSGGGLGVPLQSELHSQVRLRKVSGKALFHEEVPQKGLRALQNVHIPENAAHAQLILVLQIGAVAPLQHQHGNGVGTIAQELGHLKLRGAVGDLAVAHKAAVDPQVEAGVHALKVQEEPGTSGFGEVEVPVVQAAGVLVGHIGRVHGDGVADVGVHMPPVAVVLPAGGHRDGLHQGLVQAQPALAVHRVQEGLEITEGPLAAEGQGFGLTIGTQGDVIAAVGFCAHMQGMGVLMIACG